MEHDRIVSEFAEAHADDPLYDRLADEVTDWLDGDASGHDMHHAWRVFNLGVRIAETEGADVRVVGTAALVHDVHRAMGDGPGVAPEESLDEVAALLDRAAAPTAIREDVLYAVEVHDRYDYRGDPPAETLEAEVLQDADNLDAIGAVGIARDFAFCGAHGNPLWAPEDEDRPSGVDHVYDKLLKLREEMNTPTGRTLAEERHEFLVTFVDRLEKEWYGRL